MPDFHLHNVNHNSNVLTDLTVQRRRRGRGRRHALPEFSEDLQGNDYEVCFCLSPPPTDKNSQVTLVILFAAVFLFVHTHNKYLQLTFCERDKPTNTLKQLTCLSGSAGVRGASRRRRVQKVELEGNPKVSHQNVPSWRRRWKHSVSPTAALMSLFAAADADSPLPIDWQVSDLLLWLHWWGQAEDVAVFPWLPRPLYWQVVKGNTHYVLWMKFWGSYFF